MVNFNKQHYSQLQKLFRIVKEDLEDRENIDDLFKRIDDEKYNELLAKYDNIESLNEVQPEHIHKPTGKHKETMLLWSSLISESIQLRGIEIKN